MPVWIGTSGWQYRHWDGRFYPAELAKDEQLAWYAARYRVVEVNFTFYRLPEAEVFRTWARQTPDDFLFVVKASRFLTHMKKLKDPEEPVERLMSRARELGPKLAAVLLQLPPNMGRNDERLARVLELFGREVRVALEPRHASWFAEEVREALARHGAALCLADRGGEMVTPVWRTAGWGYFRFHGGTAAPPGCYERRTLAARAELLARLWSDAEDVFVFFNNDLHSCALRDAERFAGEAAACGLPPSRVATGTEGLVDGS